MEENEIDKKNAPLIKAYQDKVEMLSNLIDKLEDRKRILDTAVETHKAHSLNIEAAESQLRELLKEIEFRKQVGLDTSKETNELVGKKLLLEEEVNKIQVSVDQKKQYISDIEKYPAQTKLLQEEMEAFQNEHAENKRKAEQELQNIKEKVKELHTHIGIILNK